MVKKEITTNTRKYSKPNNNEITIYENCKNAGKQYYQGKLHTSIRKELKFNMISFLLIKLQKDEHNKPKIVRKK